MNEISNTDQNGVESGTGELISHYVIELAGELYALPQSNDTSLSWVQRPQEPTYLPTLPAWCLGLVNERNTPVLLVDLRGILGLPPRETPDLGDQARHVFVERAGDTIGLLVDRTRRFRLLPLQPMSPNGDFIACTVRAEEGVVRILNLEAIWRFTLQELGAPLAHQAVA